MNIIQNRWILTLGTIALNLMLLSAGRGDNRACRC